MTDEYVHGKVQEALERQAEVRELEEMMREPRKCEVCGHKWKSKFGYSWILRCPSCKVSGYHIPELAELPDEREENDRSTR